MHPAPPRHHNVEYSDGRVRRHDSIYYADGDIVVLSLPDSEHIVTAFKVDKILLSRHSPVFQAMLCLPAPNGVDLYDGMPLVRLQDHAEHLAPFLTALYDATVLPFAKHSPDTVAKVEGVLKLSDKYQVTRLHERVEALLCADWPSTLDAWDINEMEIQVIKQAYEFKLSNSTETVDDVLPEPCSVIRLARDYNIKQILPAAFYHLSRIPTFADPSAPDPDTGKFPEEYWNYIYDKGRTAKFSLLSSRDFLCLLRGIRCFAPTVRELARDAQVKTTASCTAESPRDRKACVIVLEKFVDDLHRDAAGFVVYGSYDPLDAFLCKGFGAANEPCDGCRRTFSERMRQARYQLWDRLPVLFGLHSR